MIAHTLASIQFQRTSRSFSKDGCLIKATDSNNSWVWLLDTAFETQPGNLCFKHSSQGSHPCPGHGHGAQLLNPLNTSCESQYWVARLSLRAPSICVVKGKPKGKTLAPVSFLCGGSNP